MSNTQERNFIPTTANDVRQGSGTPVILIHGIAASLHDWDDLIPILAEHGYAAYALDLLGHGDSPRLDSRAYQMDWIFEHFVNWMKSLRLSEPAILIGHSLGGHVALEYARRVSAWTRGLVLVNPFYSPSQLHLLLRKTYGRGNLGGKAGQKSAELVVPIPGGHVQCGGGTQRRCAAFVARTHPRPDRPGFPADRARCVPSSQCDPGYDSRSSRSQYTGAGSLGRP